MLGRDITAGQLKLDGNDGQRRLHLADVTLVLAHFRRTRPARLAAHLRDLGLARPAQRHGLGNLFLPGLDGLGLDEVDGRAHLLEHRRFSLAGVHQRYAIQIDGLDVRVAHRDLAGLGSACRRDGQGQARRQLDGHLTGFGDRLAHVPNVRRKAVERECGQRDGVDVVRVGPFFSFELVILRCG